jgi:hypothetical protein
MYAAPGIGLAATQVDVRKQVIVLDVSERRDSALVLINPEILDASGVSDIEGCLSVPAIYETLERAERVRVRACDQNGNAFTLGAVCSRYASSTRWITSGQVFVEACRNSSNSASARGWRSSFVRALKHPASSFRRYSRFHAARWRHCLMPGTKSHWCDNPTDLPDAACVLPQRGEKARARAPDLEVFQPKI